MSSYLWIGGAIQADPTRRPVRRRMWAVAFATLVLAIALVASKAMTEPSRQGAGISLNQSAR